MNSLENFEFDNDELIEPTDEEPVDMLHILDDVPKEDEEAEEDKVEEKITNANLYKYLLDQLLIPEYLRNDALAFIYKGERYIGTVMAKSKKYNDRFVFKIAPDDIFKGFWIDEISLI